MKLKILHGIANQVIKRDIGMSASCIIDRYQNKEKSESTSRPHDSGDFGRCYRMIEETGISIDCMTGVSLEWNNIVCMWEPLCKAYEKGDGSFYPLLQEIVNIGR